MTNPYAPPGEDPSVDQAANRYDRGRLLACVIGAGTITGSLVVNFLGYASDLAPVRFVLTVLLGYFLFVRGTNWAKVTALLIYGFSALFGLVTIGALPFGARTVVLSCLTFFYGWCAWLLAASPSIRTFSRGETIS